MSPRITAAKEKMFEDFVTIGQLAKNATIGAEALG